jgi:hypothetical protein
MLSYGSDQYGQNTDIAPMPSTLPYDLPFSCLDQISASEVFGSMIMVRTITLPALLIGSLATCDTPPTTSNSQLNVKVNGTVVGSVLFTPVSNSGVFTFTNAITLNAGDKLEIVTDATVFDISIANISMTLVGSFQFI